MNERWMRTALSLARRGRGLTSPNPMVGAVLIKNGRIIGSGWHRKAGAPHAEIEALNDARARKCDPRGATLFVTLEPCCTHGRTPPCTDAILKAGIGRVVAAATDPNPRHAGKGFTLLRSAGLLVESGLMGEKATELNRFFNHWITNRLPYVTVKAAMTLDGKIATASGDSKWITGDDARDFGMKLRQEHDAILVGIETILADNPGLTFRPKSPRTPPHCLRRFILDSRARTPVDATVLTDDSRALTTIVVGPAAPKARLNALSKKVNVLAAPLKDGRVDLEWLLKHLGESDITSLLVEGGGEVNASFLLGGLAQEAAFFYAPKVLGGRDARRGVAGPGATSWEDAIHLEQPRFRRLGPDLLLRARVRPQR